MTLIALSGYAATACIPTVFYYSFAVKKRALLVVTALASCTFAMVFWLIILGIAKGIGLGPTKATAYVLTLCSLVGCDAIARMCIENFVAGQDMTKSDAKVISPEILSAVTASDFGQAACRMIYFHLSFLTSSSGRGSQYPNNCQLFPLFWNTAMTSFLLVTTYSCGKYSRASTCKLAEISQSFRCFAPRVFSIYRKSVHGQLSGSVVLSSCTNRLCFPSVTLAKRNLLLIINVPWERLCSVNIISHADYESAGAIFHLQLVVDPQSLMNGRLTSFRTLTQSKLLQSSSGIFVHIPSALH